MAKQHVHAAPKVREDNILFSIKLDRKSVKVRKALPPGTQVHRDLKAYSRKKKHPHRADD